MKVKVVRNFFDKENDLELQKKDKIIEVSEKRADQLIKMKFAERIQETKKETQKSAAE